MKERKAISWWLLWGVISAIYCCVYVASEFIGTPIGGFVSLLKVLGQWLVISIPTAALLALLSLNRIVMAVTLPLLTLLSTISAYYSLTIGTGISAMSLEIAFYNTTASMWGSVITPGLIFWIVFSLAIAIVAIVARWKYTKPLSKKYNLWIAGVSLAITLLPWCCGNRLQSAFMARLPYRLYESVHTYILNHNEISQYRPAFDDVPASAPDDAPMVVVVLGESLRADHLPMNGYSRQTMPLLSADTAVVSLGNMYTPETHTAVAVPYIMSRADGQHRDLGYKEPSFITLFKRAGYSTAWFANQELSPTYVYFAHEADTLVYTGATRSVYAYNQWLDSDMLPDIKAWLDSSKKQLAVIHTIGSHWWYNSHYTPSQSRFKPELRGKDIASETHEAFINSYDNTIIATDEFLKSITDMLRDRNALLIYISDHGEGLGEDGKYLHASDADALHRPAAIVWYSPSYAKKYPEKVAALRQSAKTPLDASTIFHSVLDCADITTPVLNKTQSIFYEHEAH